MNRPTQALVLAVALFFRASPALAEERDPLAPAEVDLIRESKDDPPRRMKLYVKFTQQRVDALNQLLHAEKPPADRAKQVRELLEDFTALSEEIADNLEMFQRYRDDLRKSMKIVTDAYASWRTNLAEARAAMTANDQAKEEYRRCLSVLESAEESVDDGAKLAAEVAHKQQEMAAEAKEKKKSHE